MIETDVVVVGAGPVGLFQLFQLGLQGLNCHVLESVPHAGGQCVELYPNKPIYDIAAVPVCTGVELTQYLLQQLSPFSIGWHFEETVTELRQQADGRICVRSQNGLVFQSRAVVLALGVGAFVPRGLNLEGVGQHLNQQIFLQSYDALAPLTQARVMIYGGAEAVLEKALALAALPACSAPKQIYLLHRRDVFKGSQGQLAQFHALRSTGRIQVVLGQIKNLQTNDNGRLSHIVINSPDGITSDFALDILLVYQGISPRLAALESWGLALEHKQLTVPSSDFSTNIAGVYAVGDIANYPGKRKLIVCGFHEATLTAYAIAQYLQSAPIPLQYTTTSTKFLQRLGKLQPKLPVQHNK